jgi:hypothetical protein
MNSDLSGKLAQLIQSGSGPERLKSVQEFDAAVLEREHDLGRAHKFTEVADAARKTIALYRLVDPGVAELLHRDHANQLYKDAYEVLEHFKAAFDFDPNSSSAISTRETLNKKASEMLQKAHAHLPPYMAESARISQRDFQAEYERLASEQTERVAASQSMLEETKSEVEALKENIKQALEGARAAAVQSGVTFQAAQFHQAATAHETAARRWLVTTYIFAVILATWAVTGPLALSWLATRSGVVVSPEQLIASKILSFAVVSFLLVVAARSFFAHRHNAVVNHHRQNALVTYKAIVEASGNPATRDIVLQYAASCIFGPQSTGYSREGKSGPPTVQNVIESLGSKAVGTEHA